MRKAFTLIELIVAMAVLAVVLLFAGLIFRVSIESHRMAIGNAEIMQKLRVITEQLDTDFGDAAFDYGGKIAAHTRTYTIDGEEVDVNSDSIVLIANGDFQSTEQYDVDGEDVTIAGNVAAIYYGPPDPCSYDREPEPRDRLLLRRQTILAPTASEEHSDPNGEYYATSLEQWFTGTPAADLDGWVERPLIEPDDLEGTMSMYLAKGVDNFTIAYVQRGGTIGTDPLNWQRRVDDDDDDDDDLRISPYAFKFTFTLYDSRGIIKNGRTFTHIVYLGSSL
jgi:prepilin-type N-terminal cleavage/methylation domain-containing protein